MGLAGEYLKSLFQHWKAVIVSIAALIAIANNLNKLQQWLGLPWWAWVLTIVISLNVAQFLAWRDMRRKWTEALKAHLAQSREFGAGMKALQDQLRQQVEEFKSLNSRPSSQD
jgi:hypothetical protein